MDTDTPTHAQTEAIAEALAAVGLTRVSFDLTLPMLTPTLMDDAGIQGPQRAALARALDRKDAAAVKDHGGALAPVLSLKAEAGAATFRATSSAR